MKRLLIALGLIYGCCTALPATAQRLAAVRSRVPIRCTATPATVTPGALVTLTMTAGTMPTAVPVGALIHYEWFGRNIVYPSTSNGSVAQVKTTGLPAGTYKSYGEVLVLKNNTQYAREQCTVQYEVQP